MVRTRQQVLDRMKKLIDMICELWVSGDLKTADLLYWEYEREERIWWIMCTGQIAKSNTSPISGMAHIRSGRL